jgi:hypothetical protein
MQGTDSLKVERVEMTGNVDGMQLEPQLVRADSLRPKRDSVRPRPDGHR